MKPIATIYTDFPQKFGIPRQSGLVETLEGKIIFEKPFRNKDAVRGLEGFSHLWLIWEFSENKTHPFSPTVRPPRLGGNIRMGVFATRSPFRPNPIGLSCVKIAHIDLEGDEAPIIYVHGADLMNGTPIFDIKPYVREDCHPDARCGFTDEKSFPQARVHINEAFKAALGEKAQTLIRVLENRPVPAYQSDPQRVYGMSFAGKEIRFTVDGDEIEVVSVE